MSGRELVGAALLAGLGFALWRRFGSAATTLPGPLLQAPSALSWPPDGLFQPAGGGSADVDASDYAGSGAPPAAAADANDYASSTAYRESRGQLYAKNPKSSASGVYQFTKATWLAMGGQWGNDPAKAFGGLTPSLAEQQMRFDRLTQQNSSGLARAGIAATNAALYAAHFLGVTGAIRVLTAAPSTMLASLLSSAVMAANPQLRGFTVADFKNWLARQG